MTRPRFEACSVRGPLSFPNRSWQSTEEALEGSREGGEPSNPAGFRYLQGSTRGQDFSFGENSMQVFRCFSTGRNDSRNDSPRVAPLVTRGTILPHYARVAENRQYSDPSFSGLSVLEYDEALAGSLPHKQAKSRR